MSDYSYRYLDTGEIVVINMTIAEKEHRENSLGIIELENGRKIKRDIVADHEEIINTQSNSSMIPIMEKEIYPSHIPGTMETVKYFWEGMKYFQHPTMSHLCSSKILDMAEIWKNQDQYLYAGLANSLAITTSSRLPNLQLRHEWSKMAICHYKMSMNKSKNPLETILALMKIYLEFYRFESLLSSNHLEVSRSKLSTIITLVERITEHFCEHPDVGEILIHGFYIQWVKCATFLLHIPKHGTKTTYTHVDDESIYFRVDPAFELLIEAGDYRGAWNICEKYSTFIDSPKLKGWYSAVNGFVDTRQAHKWFDKAADWFNKDDLKKNIKRYTNSEVGLVSFDMGDILKSETWELHFRSRSLLALVALNPDKAIEYILKASQFAKKLKPVSVTEVKRFDFLLNSLAELFEEEQDIDLSKAHREFLSVTQWREEYYDAMILKFIDDSFSGLELLKNDRRKGLAKIRRAISILERLPILGGRSEEAFEIALDISTIKMIEGQANNWIYRKLSNIEYEDPLRRLLLRLFQNQIPHYAQIRHGPFEYGKDIAVVVSEEEINTLRLYQVKCKDISSKDWYNTCRPQLEQIFQIPIPEFQIPVPIHRRVGILIWNGHINPHIEKITESWKSEQLLTHNREYQFMNLDDIINYIMDNRLVSSLREALDEFCDK
jgi:hypothetical protein